MKSLKYLHRVICRKRLETGFSMLEAVVVVGVLLALAVGGFLSYGSITSNAKTAKVKSEASSLYTAAAAASADGDSTTDPLSVIEGYTDGNTKFKAIIKNAAGSSDTNNFSTQSGEDFCVIVTNLENTDISSTFGNCDAVSSGNQGGESGPIDSGDGTVILANPHNVETALVSYLERDLSVYSLPEFLAVNQAGWSGPAYDAFMAIPIGAEWDSTVMPARMMFERQNLLNQETNGIKALHETALDAESAFYNNPTAETQAALLAGYDAVYRAALQVGMPEGLDLIASPSYPQKFGTLTAVAGTSDTINIAVALPSNAGANWNGSSFTNGSNFTISIMGDRPDWLTGSMDGTLRNDGGAAYWNGSIFAPAGGWVKDKTYTVAVMSQDTTSGFYYTTEIKVTGQ